MSYTRDVAAFCEGYWNDPDKDAATVWIGKVRVKFPKNCIALAEVFGRAAIS